MTRARFSWLEFPAIIIIGLAVYLNLQDVVKGLMPKNVVHNDAVQIEWLSPLFPSLVAVTPLEFRVRDSSNTPIEDAALEVEATMKYHPSMKPIKVKLAGGADGLYIVPIEWTGSGDWIVTVRALLTDGSLAEDQFVRTVDGMQPCNSQVVLQVGQERWAKVGYYLFGALAAVVVIGLVRGKDREFWEIEVER
ncbi:MAG: hypothetical protein AB1791_15880 [Chloroflexota bacterium]